MSKSTHVRGVDISQYQPSFPVVDPSKFVIIRISHGLTEDIEAGYHIEMARRRKVPFAVYHYTEAGSGVEQARFAVNVMEKHGAWGVKLVCDAEGQAPESAVSEFIKEAKLLLKPSLVIYKRRQRVGIYSGNWAKEHGGGTFGADFGWLADYTAFDRPSHWSTRFTKLWQYTSSAGTLDRDFWMVKFDYKVFFQPINKKGQRVK